MKIRMLTYFMAVFALSIIASMGCSGQLDGGEAYVGPVSRIIISGSSSSGLKYYDASGNLVFDTTAGAGASGETDDGIHSGADVAEASCVFITGSASVNGYIQIVNDDPTFSGCISKNKCINCDLTTIANGLNDDCEINCTGYVPSNALSAADSVDISITWTHDFYTDMASPGGMIRFDGEELDPVGAPWDEFDWSDDILGFGLVPDVESLCYGGVGYYLGVDSPEDWPWLYERFPDHYKFATRIWEVDPDPGNGLSSCTIYHSMSARMSLEAADDEPLGQTIDLTRGPVWLWGQLCADKLNCPTPELPSPGSGSAQDIFCDDSANCVEFISAWLPGSEQSCQCHGYGLDHPDGPLQTILCKSGVYFESGMVGCFDSIDNDGDTDVDCDDIDCRCACFGTSCDFKGPIVSEVCNDCIDNDNDGFTDCGDSDCAADSACVEP